MIIRPLCIPAERGILNELPTQPLARLGYTPVLQRTMEEDMKSLSLSLPQSKASAQAMVAGAVGVPL